MNPQNLEAVDRARYKDFSKLGNDDKLTALKAYWTVLNDMFPQAFEKNTHTEYMLLKALGVHSMNWLARDLFYMCLKQGCDFGDTNILKNLLRPLNSFDWSVRTSPLSSLGGMKGVNKAHDLLLAILSQRFEILEDK